MDISGIQGKLMDNAHFVAFLASAYQRYNGDIGAIVNQFTSGGFLDELTRTLGNMNVLKYKLLDSPHAYTSIFKISLGARILMEFLDIIPQKYAKPLERAALGAGIAAVLLPGSGGGGADHGMHHQLYQKPQAGWAGHFTMKTVAPTRTLSTPVAGIPRPS